jgi:hypothetical protein
MTKHTSGGKPEFLGSGQEDHGVRFSPRKVAAGDVGVEKLLQGHPMMQEAIVEALFGGEGVQPDPLEEQLGVL